MSRYLNSHPSHTRSERASTLHCASEVGYGDLYPETPMGRLVASITAFLGGFAKMTADQRGFEMGRIFCRPVLDHGGVCFMRFCPVSEHTEGSCTKHAHM